MPFGLTADLKREAEDLIKAVLATFTTEYVKAFALAMVEKAKLDAQEEPRELILEEREPSKADRLEGWMVKEGSVRKSWKKRYFVVRHDYVVDYYESEEEAKKEKGKTKGSMSLCGYSVIDDVNNGLITRLRNLAEKMGMDVAQLPKPKEYPEHTLEIHHSRRRCYFITCENKESFKKWVEEFQTCCRRAYGLRDKEWVHERAFRDAVRKTRWSLGRWGYWSYGGSEEQILSDLIVDELEYVVFGRILSGLSGPWIVRNKLRKVITKALDTIVMAAVVPAWKVMSETVATLRPKVEPTIKELADPLGKMEAELVAKIREAVMSTLEPLLKEHVAPHLQKPIDIIRGPLREAFEESQKIFAEHVSGQEQHLTDDAGKQKAFRHLDWLPYGWEMWRATDKFDATYEVLWDLRTIFPDIYPWSLIWRARDEVRQTTDNAVYTYEKRLEEAGVNAENSTKLRAELMEDYEHDSALSTRNLCEEILKMIIMPVINTVVRTPCKALLEPLAGAIPDNMKDFLDIQKLFDDVLDDVIHHSIVAVLGDDAGPSHKGKIKEKKHHSHKEEKQHKEEHHEHKEEHHHEIKEEHHEGKGKEKEKATIEEEKPLFSFGVSAETGSEAVSVEISV